MSTRRRFLLLGLGLALASLAPLLIRSVSPAPSASRASTASASAPNTPGAPALSVLSPVASANPSATPASSVTSPVFYRRTRTLLLDPAFASTAARDPDAQIGQRWRFELFDDVAWDGRVTRAETVAPGRVNLYGELEGVAGSDFIVTLHGSEAAAMSFTTPGAPGVYQVRTAAPGLLVAIELAPELMPPCALDTARTSRDPALAHQARQHAALLARHAADINPTGSAYGSFGQQGGSADGLAFTEVDLMIAYTSAAEAGAGGEAGVVALSDHMVARANATFINSRVGLRLRLVRLEAVDYDEPGNIQTDLNNLTNTSDGQLDALHALRTAVGADLVTLLIENPGPLAAGLAWFYDARGGDAAYGFNVVQRAGGESTLVHEIGHNLGCEHDRDNAEADPIYDYAYGHRFTPEGYAQLRTVMAYAPGTRVPYFSNPDVTYLGAPTGVAIGETGEAHNAQVLNNTKAAIAAFRATAGNQPPAVALTTPAHADSLVALQNIPLAVTAADPDGTIASVRFYQLSADNRWAFSNVTSVSLGADVEAPYEHTVANAPAGYYTFAVVATDDDGAVATDSVSVVVNPWYKQELLSLPVGYTNDVSLAAINDSGQIAGTVKNGALQQACRWDGTAAIPLGFLPGDVASRALAIADDGTVYGQSISAGGVLRACRWSPAGVITDLSTAVDGQTLVSALGRDDTGRTLYAIASERGYRDSTSLGGNFLPEAIASSGIVAGTDHDSGAGAWRAARWNGSSTRLSPLGSNVSSWGWTANRSGAVVGISSPTSGYSSATWQATYWAAGSTTPVDLTPAGATASNATGINDHNEIVGHYYTSANQPFLWTSATGSIPLRDVVMRTTGFDLYFPRAISNTGAIAIEGWTSAYVPARLTPVAGMSHQHWLRSQFAIAEIEDTGIAGDNDDPDNDGRPNLLERAFGLSPTVAEATLSGTGYPELGFDEDANKLTLTFRRLRAPTDLVYTVEATANLTALSWSSAGAVEVSRTAIDADWEEVVYRSVASPAPGAPVFMRVRVGR